jgi:hypothetical protein
MEDKSKQVFLVVGATSGVGSNVVKSLLSKNRKVRIIISNDTKLSTFTDDERSKIDSVIICNILTDTDYQQKLDSVFTQNETKVTHVISCLSLNKADKCHDSFFIAQTRLIEPSKKYNIERFLLISSAHVTKPYSCHSLSLNLKHHYTQWNRVRAEEYLRNSGVRYLIVRAGDLVTGNDCHDYTINQGDKLEGSINIYTLGKLAVDTFLDPWIPENVTYECVTYDKQQKEKYSYVQGRFRLHQDTEKDKKQCNSLAHVRACRLIKCAFLFVCSAGAFSIAYHLNEHLRKWVKDNLTHKLLK